MAPSCWYSFSLYWILRALMSRIEAALDWRRVVAAGAEACRLVHGEADRLPSLVVDRYGDFLVVQTLSQGTERAKDEIVSALVQRLSPRGVLERNDPRVRALEGLERTVSVLRGTVPELVDVAEGDVRLQVDLRRGQKTGLFLDQRENHLVARRYARGRVLDASGCETRTATTWKIAPNSESHGLSVDAGGNVEIKGAKVDVK